MMLRGLPSLAPRASVPNRASPPYAGWTNLVHSGLPAEKKLRAAGWAERVGWFGVVAAAPDIKYHIVYKIVNSSLLPAGDCAPVGDWLRPGASARLRVAADVL